MVHLKDARRYLCDPEQLINVQNRDSIDHYLYALDKECGIESVFVIVNHVDNGDTFRYATEIGKKYGVGDKRTHRGLVVVVAVKDHRYFIATGKALKQTSLTQRPTSSHGVVSYPICATTILMKPCCKPPRRFTRSLRRASWIPPKLRNRMKTAEPSVLSSSSPLSLYGGAGSTSIMTTTSTTTKVKATEEAEGRLAATSRLS